MLGSIREMAITCLIIGLSEFGRIGGHGFRKQGLKPCNPRFSLEDSMHWSPSGVLLHTPSGDDHNWCGCRVAGGCDGKSTGMCGGFPAEVLITNDAGSGGW